MTYAFVAIALLLGVLLAVVAVESQPVGAALGVVVGATIAYVATYVTNQQQRQQEAKDLARALYHEIADRAARCWFDFQHPWKDFLPPRAFGPGKMDVFRVRKFRPTDPVIYPNVASKIAYIDPETTRAVMHFYFRLDAWRRDIDSWATSPIDTELEPGDFHLLAIRLRQTLRPGLEALEKLGGHVPEAASIDRTTMAIYAQEDVGLRAAMSELLEETRDNIYTH